MKGRLVYIQTYIAVLLCYLIYVQPVGGQNTTSTPVLNEDATISLLTVYPRDKAIYAIFGHTAIRVQDAAQNIDWVYNYGYFDSSRPNFIYHFVKGETDYVLGIDLFGSFIFSYAKDNSHIEEQVLNLSLEGKKAIFNFLNENALPENREYRYNYFFDNCTTRPRDIIEKFIPGKIIYPEQDHPTSFRTLVHHCTQPYPWLSFGIDLVLGSGADSTIHLRNEMFLPVKLMFAFDKATVVEDSIQYPLVKSTQTVLSPTYEEDDKKSTIFTPILSGGILLLITLCVSVAGLKKKRLFKGYDFALFLSAGIAGCIVWFICFISTHPCTSCNYNVLWLQPLHIIAAFFFLLNIGKKAIKCYHLFNFAVLTLLLSGWYFIPQQIPFAAFLMALCLWLRSGYHLLISYKCAKENK